MSLGTTRQIRYHFIPRHNGVVEISLIGLIWISFFNQKEEKRKSFSVVLFDFGFCESGQIFQIFGYYSVVIPPIWIRVVSFF